MVWVQSEDSMAETARQAQGSGAPPFQGDCDGLHVSSQIRAAPGHSFA